MPTLQVSRTYNIQKSIDYVTSEKAHYNHEQTEGKRVQWASGVNVPITNKTAFMSKMHMREVQKEYGKDKGYVQGYSIIQGFGADEIDPKGAVDSRNKAHDLGLQFAQQVYGENNQAIVVTQCDGKSGLWHNHIISNAVGLDGKSQRGNMTKWTQLAKINDEIALENGLTPLDKDNWQKNKDRKRDAKAKGQYQTPIEKRMRKNGVVLAKDEVIEQIRIARDEPAVQNIDDFKQLLHEEYNIDVLEARAKDGENLRYSYEYTNKKGLTNTKVSRASTLAGEEFQLTPLTKEIEKKVALQQAEKEKDPGLVDYGLDIEEELNTPQAQMMIQNLLQKDEEEEEEELELEFSEEDLQVLNDIESEVKDYAREKERDTTVVRNNNRNQKQHSDYQHNKSRHETNTTRTKQTRRATKSKDDGFTLE